MMGISEDVESYILSQQPPFHKDEHPTILRLRVPGLERFRACSSAALSCGLQDSVLHTHSVANRPRRYSMSLGHNVGGVFAEVFQTLNSGPFQTHSCIWGAMPSSMLRCAGWVQQGPSQFNVKA